MNRFFLKWTFWSNVCLLLLLLNLAWPVGALPPAQIEIDITTVTDQINRWHLNAFREYRFNQWISLGDVNKFSQRIADGDMQAFIDAAYLNRIGANAAYVDCEGIGCSTYMNDIVLNNSPDQVPAQTLWHEAMHAIFDAYDMSLLVNNDEMYTWYVENVINQALPWLIAYEEEWAKKEACDQKKLDEKWAKFVDKMDKARDTGYGVLSTQAQLDQLEQLTGFRVDPDTIRINYQAAGMDKCPAATPATLADLDLIFCIDVTGSMADDIAGVKAAASNIVDKIVAKGKSYQVAIIAYRDWDDSVMFEDYPFSSDKATIIANINSLSVGGGGDTPEAVLEALMRGIDSRSVGGWRNNVNKQIILMGDAPPHDPSRGGLTAAIVAQAAEDADPVVIQAVLVGNGGVYDKNAEAAFAELARLTGGNLFKAENASQVPAVLEKTIAEIQTPGGPGLSPTLLWVLGGLCLLLMVALGGVLLLLLLFSGRRRQTPRPSPNMPYPAQPYPPGPLQQPYPPTPPPGAYPQSPPAAPPPYARPTPQSQPAPAQSVPPPAIPWQGETVLGMSAPVTAELVFENRTGAGRRVPLSANLRIGRAPDNNLILDDAQVSRHHAVITLVGNDYVISDLGSANGVLINGVRIQQPTILRAGDLIGIGTQQFRFSR